MKRFESALLVRSFDLPSFRPSPFPRLPLPRPLPQLEWIACVHGKALLVMVAHAVTTTREKQEERYTLRLRLWRAALLTIINMIAIIREPACVLIASQRPPWTMAVLLSGGIMFFTLFLPLIFRRIFLLLDLPFAKGWSFLAVNRVLSLFFVLNDWKIDSILLLEEGCYWKELYFKDKKLMLRWKGRNWLWIFLWIFELYSAFG